MAKISDFHAKMLLERRHLDPVTCEKLGVRTINQGTIGFDYFVEGKLHNTHLRTADKKFPWEHEAKDRPLTLWNIDSLRAPLEPDEFLVITEGEFDGIACVQAGMSRVVSVPNGAPHSENEGGSRFAYLYKGEKLIPEIQQFIDRKLSIVIASDADGPGQNLRDALAVRLGDEHCLWVQWPDEVKDANAMLIAAGEEALFDLVSKARPVWNDVLSRLDDIPDEVQQLYDSGLFGLDLKIELPSFMVICGPPSSGKSLFLRQFLWGLWRLHKWPFLLTTLEEKVKTRIHRHFRALEIGNGFWKSDEINRADDLIRDGVIFFRRPLRLLLDKNTFLDKVELAIRRDGVKVVALDPVNELDHDFGDLSETRYWGQFIMDCKRIADVYGILFICCGHPPKGSTEAIAKRGRLSVDDMIGSYNWKAKADLGLAMWRTGVGEGLPTMLYAEKFKDEDSMGRPNFYELTKIGAKFEVTNRGPDIMKKNKEKKDEKNGEAD